MKTVRITFKGVQLDVTGDTDGHQFDVDSIELVDENELTDLILSLDEGEVERLASEVESEPDEDRIYESLNDR